MFNMRKTSKTKAWDIVLGLLIELLILRSCMVLMMFIKALSLVTLHQKLFNIFFMYQMQNLALRAHLPGALGTAHSVILKPSGHSHTLSPAASLSKTSICALKTNQMAETSTEAGQTDVTRLTSGTQIIAPGESQIFKV